MGKGSSLPGQVALKVCPGVLKRLKLPKTIIAVTGSNGKTSTAELIAHALISGGKKVGWNYEGANQIEGVATLLLRISGFDGTVKRDALVLECDERYARIIFNEIRPSALIVTNLCRDQLTRNGHHEFVQDCIHSAIKAAGGEVKLILNADDPYVAALAATEFGIRNSEFGVISQKDAIDISSDSNSHSLRIIWFGVGSCVSNTPPKKLSALNSQLSTCGAYDDGAFCPICKGRMTYEYRVAGHYGSYRCGICNFCRPEPDIEITSLDYESGEATIIPNSEFRIPNLSSDFSTRLAFPSLTGAYNLAAATAAVAASGYDIKDAASALDGYDLKGGRTIRFSVGGRSGILLVSKHENSLSYNQSLAWVAGQGKPCTVLILVDSISRKYYTSETSWLWDVDFELLADECVRNIVLAGRYVNELMARFAMSAVNPEKISYIADPGGIREHLEQTGEGDIYAITCFADKAKLLQGLGVRG